MLRKHAYLLRDFQDVGIQHIQAVSYNVYIIGTEIYLKKGAGLAVNVQFFKDIYGVIRFNKNLRTISCGTPCKPKARVIFFG